MDDTSTEDLGVVSIASVDITNNGQLIQGIFTFELIIHILAIAFNLILFFSLQVYRGYHVHLRILCRHVTIGLIFTSVYSAVRCFYFLKDWNYGGESYMDLLPVDGCGFIWQMPLYSCFLLCVFPIAIVVERNVATRNFNIYEHTENHKLLNFLCNFTYIPYPIMILYYLSVISSPRSSQVACELQNQKTPTVLRNTGQIIMSAFLFICSKHFELLIQKNSSATKEYIQNNYSSISPRYQLRENIFTCQVLLKLTRVMCISCLLPVLIGLTYINNQGSPMERLMQASVWYLSATPICLSFPLLLLVFDDKLLRRIPEFCKTSLGQMFSTTPQYLPLCVANARNTSSSFLATTA